MRWLRPSGVDLVGEEIRALYVRAVVRALADAKCEQYPHDPYPWPEEIVWPA